MRHIVKSLITRRRPCHCVFSNTRFLSQEQDRNSNNDHDQNNYFKESSNLSLVVASALGSLTTYLLYDKLYANRNKVLCAQIETEDEKEESIIPGEVRNDLPFYTLAQVADHNTKGKGIWVIYKQGVYDITEFIIGHPGGDQILMAAGNSVEPFWLLYGIHKNQHVYQILETLRIGNISKSDAEAMAENIQDPYYMDPKRHPLLKPASRKPFNAEPPPALLVKSFITPVDFFYVRNHLPVPEIDPKTYELELEIEGTDRMISFSLEELKRMPKTTITATIMCAGNRRSDMTKIKPVKGLNWGPAAIGNATWTGVRLSDILHQLGIDENSNFDHCQFEGIDVDTTSKNYGASIPFWRAIDKRGDVLLAYEMNGAPIPRDHGFPIRVIVPGVVGARNVKWLGKIILSSEESDSHWQQNDYKGFSPCTDWDTVDFSKAPAIQELPVISAICKPSDGEVLQVEDGYVVAKGYAWSGGGQRIVRVDVTIDDGKTWMIADIDAQDKSKPPQHWSWTLWSIKIPVAPGTKQLQIAAKAVDTCYNTQPESFENIWNLRGVLSNAYHRVNVTFK